MVIKELFKDDKFLALFIYKISGEGEYCPASYFCKECKKGYPPKYICIKKITEYINSDKDNDKFIGYIEEDFNK